MMVVVVDRSSVVAWVGFQKVEQKQVPPRDQNLQGPNHVRHLPPFQPINHPIIQ